LKITTSANAAAATAADRSQCSPDDSSSEAIEPETSNQAI